MDDIISVRGLVKRYGRREAVAGIDLEVRRGEIFALLGPNGAGKATTVEILEGFQRRTAGEVSVLGNDPATAGRAWRDRVPVSGPCRPRRGSRGAGAKAAAGECACLGLRPARG
jgi:ABC-2 type transport system ATP-binding protein